MARPLTACVLAGDLRRLVPRRNHSGVSSYAELLSDLRHFGVMNRAHLRRLMLRRIRAIRCLDAEPFDSLNERIQRDELGNAEHSCRWSKRVFFNTYGYVRLALEFEWGDRWRDYIRGTYHSQTES